MRFHVDNMYLPLRLIKVRDGVVGHVGFGDRNSRMMVSVLVLPPAFWIMCPMSHFPQSLHLLLAFLLAIESVLDPLPRPR